MQDGIVVKNARKAIRGREVLRGVDLEVKRGGVYGFFGVNGSGKTMLFRAIAALIHLDEGSVSVFGEEVSPLRPYPTNLGVILENVGLWDEYTGFDNLRLLASIRGVAGTDDVERALVRVGLDPRDKRRYGAYSLGMRQRLALAQAIMEAPDLLVLDEPTNALDVAGIGAVARILSEERDRGATILVACHNEPAIEGLVDRAFHMSEGRLAGGE